MTSRPAFADSLVAHFERIHEQHMQGLPILNPGLAVEMVGIRDYQQTMVCALITPWFMNLVLRSEAGAWDDVAEGELLNFDFPHESLDFTVCRDNEIGTYLSAVLFRTMTDFPDQQTAREIAQEILQKLFSEPEQVRQKRINRRALFTGLDAN